MSIWVREVWPHRRKTECTSNEIDRTQRQDECTVRQLALVQIALLSVLGRVIVIIVAGICRCIDSLNSSLQQPLVAGAWRSNSCGSDSSSIVLCFRLTLPFLALLSRTLYFRLVCSFLKAFVGQMYERINGRQISSYLTSPHLISSHLTLL